MSKRIPPFRSQLSKICRLDEVIHGDMYNVHMHIVGIGQCSLDYIAFIDSYPSVNTKKEVIEWHEQGGGPVATALVTLSRLGISCSFLGIVGDDRAGEKIRESIAAEGIDITGLVQRNKAVSQKAFIAVEQGAGTRTIFWQRPSGNPLSEHELQPDFLKGARFLLLDGLMSDVSISAAGAAKKENVPVMLDAGRARPGMLEVARLSDYVVASEEFANDLSWDLSEKSLQQYRTEIGTDVLTITRGEQGSITAAHNQYFHIPAFQTRAVDTTGAGDVFHGGYIYGLLKGWSLRDTILFASAVASIKCTNVGGRTGIPTFGQIELFLMERGYALPK